MQIVRSLKILDVRISTSTDKKEYCKAGFSAYGGFDGRKIIKKMEHTGLEPVTSTLPVWRAPSCANAPVNKL